MSSKSILPGPVEGQRNAGLRRALRLAALAPVAAGTFALMLGPIAHADEEPDAPDVTEDTTPVVTDDTTPVVDEEDDTPVVDEEDDTPVVDEEDDTPVVDEEDDTPVVDEEDETPVPVVLAAPVISSVARGDRSLLVSWTQPVQEGKIPLFSTVVARIGSDVKAIRYVLGDARQATIGGDLANDEAYDVTVTTAMLGEVSAVSAIVSAPPVLIADAVKVIKATAVQALDVDVLKNSALATWDAPATDGGSAILAYVVATIDESTGLLHSWRTVASDARSASVNGLKNGVGYTVNVFPVTTAGFGGNASVTRLGTNAGEALGLPTIPFSTVTKLDGGKLFVSFGAAKEHGVPVIGYNAILMQDGKMIDWSQQGDAARSALLKGYDPTKEAKIYTFATSIPGYGPAAAPVVIAATPAAPAAS